MSDPILIGTYGWQDAAWEGNFYPPELPPEWRFCFYSNKIRSLIVPAHVWRTLCPGDVEQWAEDSDTTFRFVLELPPALQTTLAVDAFFRPLARIKDFIAALLLPVSPSMSIARFDALLGTLVACFPVCVRPLGARLGDAQRECAARYRATVCWDVGQTAIPDTHGDFLIALMEDGNVLRMRAVLEQLASWPGPAKGLFFSGADAATMAQEARLLAEMMRL